MIRPSHHFQPILLALIALLLIAPRVAHAYMDPGSGSYFIQVIIAAILGGTIVLRTQLRRIGSGTLNLVRKFRSRWKQK